MSQYKQLQEMTDVELKKLVTQNDNTSSVLRKIGLNGNYPRARTLLQSRMRNLGIDLGKGRLDTTWNKEMLESAIAKSICWSDVVRLLGKSTHGSHLATARKYAVLFNISTDHFDIATAVGRNKNRNKPNDELFVSSSSTDRSVIKARILRDNLLNYQCMECNKVEAVWNGKKISLQLDHINGISNDHRLENLRFLCPNCHSQTSTFCARNKKPKG